MDRSACSLDRAAGNPLEVVRAKARRPSSKPPLRILGTHVPLRHQHCLVQIDRLARRPAPPPYGRAPTGPARGWTKAGRRAGRTAGRLDGGPAGRLDGWTAGRSDGGPAGRRAGGPAPRSCWSKPAPDLKEPSKPILHCPTSRNPA